MTDFWSRRRRPDRGAIDKARGAFAPLEEASYPIEGKPVVTVPLKGKHRPQQFVITSIERDDRPNVFTHCQHRSGSGLVCGAIIPAPDGKCRVSDCPHLRRRPAR